MEWLKWSVRLSITSHDHTDNWSWHILRANFRQMKSKKPMFHFSFSFPHIICLFSTNISTHSSPIMHSHLVLSNPPHQIWHLNFGTNFACSKSSFFNLNHHLILGMSSLDNLTVTFPKNFGNIYIQHCKMIICYVFTDLRENYHWLWLIIIFRYPLT